MERKVDTARHGPRFGPGSGRRRLAAAVTAMTLLAGGMILAGSSSVGAMPAANIVCEGPETVTYQPALMLETRETKFSSNGTFAICTSPDPTLNTGSFKTEGAGPLSCLTGNSAGTTRIEWSNGLYSVYESKTILTVQPLGITAIVEQGRVAEGWFKGVGITKVTAMMPPLLDTLDCLSTGIVQVSGPTVLVIHHL